MEWSTFAAIMREICSWNWNTFWAAFGTLAIWAAVGQLWFNAWVKAQDIFTSACFVKARTAVFAHFDDPGQRPDPNSYDAMMVCRKMDEMAHLVPFLGQKKVLREWGNPIAKAWLLLEPTVKGERERSHWDGKWRKFERLGRNAVRQNPELKKRRPDTTA